MFNHGKFVKTNDLASTAKRVSIILLAEGVFGPAQEESSRAEAEKFVTTAVESAQESHDLELAYVPSNVRVKASYCKPFRSNNVKFLQVRVSPYSGANKRFNFQHINQILELNY